MKALATFIGILAPVSAFASNGRKIDDGILVWVLLGFCALIVVSQIGPAILLLTDLIKGAASVVKEEFAVYFKRS